MCNSMFLLVFMLKTPYDWAPARPWSFYRLTWTALQLWPKSFSPQPVLHTSRTHRPVHYHTVDLAWEASIVSCVNDVWPKAALSSFSTVAVSRTRTCRSAQQGLVNSLNVAECYFYAVASFSSSYTLEKTQNGKLGHVCVISNYVFIVQVCLNQSENVYGYTFQHTGKPRPYIFYYESSLTHVVL